LWVSQNTRTEPLPIVGPSGNSVPSGPAGNDVAPDFATFLTRLFDEKTGAFPAMGGTLGGRGNGVRLLIMHMGIAAGSTSPLHAAPVVVGRLAQEAHVGRLIVGHIGQYDLDAAVADLRKSYSGALTVGADLQCTPVMR
jgi:hypothetical protein